MSRMVAGEGEEGDGVGGGSSEWSDWWLTGG